MSRPVLRSDRLELRPLGDEHLEDLVALDADPEVMRHLTGRASTREEVLVAHRRRTDPANDALGLGYWAGYDVRTPDGGFVGWWCLTPPDRPDQGPREGQAELGYRLVRRAWRQGFASSGAWLLLRHAFETVGLERVFAETMAVNEGSRAVMAAVGLRHERTFQVHFDDPLPGTDQGEVAYAVSAAAWREQHRTT
ncbi:GNAT family N-acetyltransferase [Angustibacter peucedani]